MDIGDLFPDMKDTPVRELPAWASPNPMVRDYGPGPENKKCGWCEHLVKRQYSKTFYKCRFRKNTHGAASDHRVNWPVCSKYQEVKM